MLASPQLVKVNQLMNRCDLGIDGIYQEYEMKFTTTTKWSKKKVKELKCIFEENGWEAGDHILTEVINDQP